MKWLKFVLAGGLLALTTITARCETFRIAAYNLENYLDQPTESRRYIKSETAKAKIRETILAMRPDVIAFEEMGQLSALLELQRSLKSAGLDLPHHEYVRGFDTNIHICVLSRFPIVAHRSHTNANFLLSGKRFQVSRGFTDVEIQVNNHYRFILLGAHLKSRRPIPNADQAELRQAEAQLLRGIVDRYLAQDPQVNLVVVGDLNDTYNTPAVKTVIGIGKNKLVDTRPAERNGDNLPNPTNPRYFPRDISWTHYYGVEDSYSRLDYLLLSPGMAREWVREETYILTIPNWGQGSDHRPILATFDLGPDGQGKD
ncbi:MAG: endonuclease/exonuclease/phosphatase family protein [Verrucomicrobiae bacterium]|nr:endonuclease/exonuclease/phosphatase family protein [Verrucomicrobiae bacterium]